MKYTEERFSPEFSNNGIEIEHFHRYKSIKEVVKGKNVLDAASGTGYGTFLLSKDAKNVVGVDISEEAIEYSKRKYKNENLTYSAMNISNLQFPNDYFDVVVSFETIEHVNSEVQHKFLSEIKRVLKKNGILIMSTPDKFIHTIINNNHNKYHVCEFYESEYLEFLNGYFTNTKFFKQSFDKFGMIFKNGTNSLSLSVLDDDVFMDQGKYIVSISSEDIGIEDIDISSVYKTKNQEIMDMLNIKVYWDNNCGYSEELSYSYVTDLSNDMEIELRVPSEEVVGRLRIDIGENNILFVEIDKKIGIINADTIVYQEFKIVNKSNIILIDEDNEKYSIVCFGEDPQLYIDKVFDNGEAKELSIKLKLFKKSINEILSLIENSTFKNC